MKKILGIAAVAAMVATSAFAEVTVGAWGRSGMNFINKNNDSATFKSTAPGSSEYKGTDGSDATVDPTPGFASGSRVGVNFAGVNADKTIGFNLNVDSNGGTVGIGDQAKVWGKIGFLTVQFGKIQLDDLRGSVGDWGNRDIGSKGEDDIFSRFYPSKGMTVELRPIDGLFIGAAIDSSATTAKTVTNAVYNTITTEATVGGVKVTESVKNVFSTKTAAVTTATTSSRIDDVFKAINVGAGYTVKDVVQIKAAYFGSAETHNGGRLEFGADLLGIKNNTIEIGVKLPLYDSDKNRNADISGSNAFSDVGADYFDMTVGISGGKDKLTYKGHVFGNFASAKKYYDNANSDKFIAAPVIGLDCGVEYDIGVCSIGGTAKYNVQFYNDSGTESGVSSSVSYSLNDFGAELYAKKNFSNGYLFAGVADEMKIYNGESKGTYTYTTTVARNTFYIPVGAEYWF